MQPEHPCGHPVHPHPAALPLSTQSIGEQRYRPLVGGCSIAPIGPYGSGTLGCIVVCGGVQYLLGTSHNLTNLNTLPVGTQILQPSAQDGGSATDIIAILVAGTQLVHGGTAQADAALALPEPGVALDPRILGQGGRLASLAPPIQNPTIGTEVQMSGRTTAYARGRIAAMGFAITLSFGVGAETTFLDQFSVLAEGSSPFSNPGDPGALVTDMDNRPVGLILAGTNGPRGETFVTPMRNVLEALGVLMGGEVTILY